MLLDDEDLVELGTICDPKDHDVKLVVAFVRRPLTIEDVKELYADWESKRHKRNSKVQLPDSLGWCYDDLGPLEVKKLPLPKKCDPSLLCFGVGGYLG